MFATGFLALLGMGMVAVAPAAWAHATLVTTSPADGAVVQQAPAQVTATFDEAVGVSSDSLEVFSPQGDRVDQGGTTHGKIPQQVTVDLRSGLGKGTYTVGWHVISADSHPVHGAWTFSIGAPSSTSVNASTLGPPVSRLIGVIFGAVRWLAFWCFAMLIGAIVFVIWCWPALATNPVVLRLTMGAWGGLAVSVLAALLLQGVYGSGEGVSRVFWPNVLHATLYSRYGRSLGVRLLLVIVALFAFSLTLGSLRDDGRRRASTPTLVTWGVLTAGFAATWAAADHAGTGIQVPLSLASDTLHLSSVAIWIGGLIMLVTVVLRRPAGGAGARKSQAATIETARAVERFSSLALTCVCVILVTGTYQAWRGVGTWDALFGSTYGRLLLIKIGAMFVLIGLGYVARQRIASMRVPAQVVHAQAAEVLTVNQDQDQVRVGAGARSGQVRSGFSAWPARGGNMLAALIGSGTGNGLTLGQYLNGNGNGNGHVNGNGHLNGSGNGNGQPSPDPDKIAVTLRRLRWSVAAEVMIAATVLAVTAILVNTATARETFIQPASATVAFSTGGPGGSGTIHVTVTPSTLGPNKLSVTIFSKTGKPYTPAQVLASLSLPARNLGPLAVSLTADGAGRYVGGPVTVTITGQWQLQFTIRSDAFDETTVVVPVPIHSAS